MISDRTIRRRIVFACILILVLIAFLFKLVIGFDPDEQAALSLAFRLTNGERYMQDIFDSYQFCALIISPVYILSEKLGSLVLNPVILFRFFSILISICLNLRLMFFVKRRTGNQSLAILSLLCMITALPKSIISLEHSNLALIFLTWIFIDLSDLIANESKSGIKLGIDGSLLSLCYPPLVLVYIPVVLIQAFNKKWKAVAETIAVSFVILMIIVLPLLISTGINGILYGISMVLSDGSHMDPLSVRMKALGVDSVFLLKYVAVYAAGIVLLYTVRIITKMQSISLEDISVSVPFFVAILQFIVRPTSPMAGSGRYLLLMILCAFLLFKNSNQRSLQVPIFIYIFSLPVIYFTSNTNLLSACGFMMLSPIIYVLIRNTYNQKGNEWASAFLILVLISQCVSMIFTYRTFGTPPHSILHFDLKKDNEVLKGMWYRNESVDFFQEITKYKDVFKGEAIIISAIYPYSYNLLGKKADVPLTISTHVYNQQWENYIANSGYATVDLIVGYYDDDTNDSEELIKILKRKYERCEIQAYTTFEYYYFSNPRV